jgi:hypothetical protein
MEISNEQKIDIVLDYFKDYLINLLNTNKHALVKPYLLVYLDIRLQHNIFNISPEYEDRWYSELVEEINNALGMELNELVITLISDELLQSHFDAKCVQFHEDNKFFKELPSSLIVLL